VDYPLVDGDNDDYETEGVSHGGADLFVPEVRTRWHADDGRMVHSAETVTPSVQPDRGAAPGSDDLSCLVGTMDGRSNPVAENVR
jgi:hypothetical protein